MDVKVVYLILSEDWLIYSEKLLSIKMLLKVVIYLFILRAGKGLRKRTVV